MYNIIQLNDKNLSELQAIAQELGIKKTDSLKKEELVYKILDEQAIAGATKKVAADKLKEERKEDKKKRSRVTVKKENADKVFSSTKNGELTKTDAKTPAAKTQPQPKTTEPTPETAKEANAETNATPAESVKVTPYATPKKKPGRSRKNGTDWELRRYVMLLAAGIVLILIGAVAMFSGKITDILGKKDGLPAEMVDTGGAGMVIEPDTKEYIQDFGGCILTENGEPGITELMNTYFQAVSDCDMDTFVKLFTSQDTSEEEHYRQEFEEQKQYISGYQNVKCYTTPGLRDGEMAAYVYYEILYTGVETPAPSLVRIYAIRAEDGSWQIDDGKMSEELTQYFEELSVNEDVRLLSKQTDEAMDAAMEQDEALKERVEFMKQGASYMQEESEPAASNP